MPKKIYDVVISGVGGKYPQCQNLSEFKEKLFSKANLLTVDNNRWNHYVHKKPHYSGRIPDSDKFDHIFFGISSKLLRNSDPLTGQVMERSYEAMVDAGVNPVTLKGCNIFVVATTSFSEAEVIAIARGTSSVDSTILGHSKSMMANRISYFFNFTGPSYRLDESWVSAMEGLERAAEMVAEGVCEAALVVTSNLLHVDNTETEYDSLGLMSSDETCSPFDAEAHGFSRSESTVAIFLQRAEDAKRHYCSVINTKVQYTGDMNAAFVQMNPHLEKFFKDFYNSSSVSPSDVSYVEAFGCCHKVFDANELNALAKGLCNENSPLLIGSVTGNVGNAEGSSAFVSLSKAIIAMETGMIPPTINYHSPNPSVPALLSGQLKPVTDATELPGDLLAVSSMSFSGSMGHSLLRRNPKSKRALCTSHLPSDELPRLVILQARNEEGIKAIVEKVTSMQIDLEFISLVNDVFKTNVGNYLWKGYTIVPSLASSPIENNTQLVNNEKRPVWFIFSGMGSQWPGMGRDLLSIPVFAAAIDTCDKVLRPRGLDIKYIITTDDSTVYNNILNSFVGIAAIQIGLVEILYTLGVSPDGMIGHSVGELGCAYADGCFTAEQMILAAYARGKASLDSDVIKGMMAAVGLGYEKLKDSVPATLDVACHNSTTSCTISGPTEDVYKYVEQLKKDGVFVKAVSAGDIAYHSRYIKPIAPKLLVYLQEAVPNAKARSSRWISSSVPQSQWDSEDARMCSAEYHTNNLLNPVLFEEACQHLPKNAILIEIAPRGLLQAILRRSVSKETHIFSLTRHFGSNIHHLLNTIGQLYLNNVAIDVNALYPLVQYPVSRGTPGLAELVTWSHKDNYYKELKEQIQMSMKQGSSVKRVMINPQAPEYELWKQRCVNDQVIMSVAQLLMYPWKMIFEVKCLNMDQQCVVIEDVTFKEHIAIDASGCTLLVSFMPASFNVEICTESTSSSATIMSGTFYERDFLNLSPSAWPKQRTEMEELTETDVYSLLAHFGFHLGPLFQGIKQLLLGKAECFAKVQWSGNFVLFMDALIQIIQFIETEEKQILMQPASFDKITIKPEFFSSLVQGAVVEVHYNRCSHHLLCEGVEFLGLTLSPLSSPKPLNLIWQELKFQPYSGENLSLDALLSASVQLAVDAGLKTWTNENANLQILVVEDDSGLLSMKLKDILKYYPRISPKVQEVDYGTAKFLLAQVGHRGCLVTGSYGAVSSLLQDAAGTQTVFCFPHETSSSTSIQTPTKKCDAAVSLNSGKVAVLTTIQNKKVPKKMKVFKVDGFDWLEQLRRQMAEDVSGELWIIHSGTMMPSQLLPILAAEPYVHRLSTLFILDKDAPQFSVTSPFYCRQLSAGLPVNILCNKHWGTLSTIYLDVSPQENNIYNITKRSLGALDIFCIGLNRTSFTLHDRDDPELKYMDYSGMMSGKRVMGAAQIDPVFNTLKADELLRWTVPADWSMEDAATVPVTFALAYYCMHVAAKVKVGESVLVHAGMSPLGQAVIGIALDLGAKVFSSVTCKDEVKALLKTFPALKPEHMLLLSSQDLRVALMKLTGGSRVDVLVNCLVGKDLQSTLKIMTKPYCRILHLSKIKAEDKEKVGMSIFLPNAFFFGVSLDNVMNSDRDIKIRIWEAVEAGLKEGVVRPLRRSSFYCNQASEAQCNFRENNAKEKTILIINELERPQKALIADQTSFICNPDHIIIVSGTKSELWLDVVEWLVNQGARRLVVLKDEDELASYHIRRLNRIISLYNLSCVITPLSQFNSLEKAVDYLSEVALMSTISYLLCICMNENDIRMKNLDSASRQVLPQLQQFVSLLCDGAAVCESRAASGLPVCSVKSVSSLQNPAHVLPYLSTIMVDSTSRSRFVVVSDSVSTTGHTVYLDLDEFLPTTVQELLSVGPSVTDQPKFTEVVTRSPGHQYMPHNVFAVFVVSGLGAEHIRPLVRQLIHPAFCCSLPRHIHSVEQFAHHLLQEVLQIQPKGPYTLVGDSWGGVIAVTLGCLLESRGHEVEMVLLEGTPTLAQDRVHALRQQFGADLGSSLLAVTLRPSVEVMKLLTSLTSWEEKLQVALRSVEPNLRGTVARALEYLNSQLTAVLQFQVTSQLFKGTVTQMHCSQASYNDLHNRERFSQQAPNLLVTEDENYQQLINNFKTASLINEKTCFSWESSRTILTS